VESEPNVNKRRNQANRARRLSNKLWVNIRRLTDDQMTRMGGTFDQLRLTNLRSAVAILEGQHGEQMAEDMWQALMEQADLNPSEGDLNPSAETRAMLLGALRLDLANLERAAQ
jgi:hypothetical protein